MFDTQPLHFATSGRFSLVSSSLTSPLLIGYKTCDKYTIISNSKSRSSHFPHSRSELVHCIFLLIHYQSEDFYAHYMVIMVSPKNVEI